MRLDYLEEKERRAFFKINHKQAKRSESPRLWALYSRKNVFECYIILLEIFLYEWFEETISVFRSIIMENVNEVERHKPFNKVHLQLIAAIAMFIDHLTWVIFPGYPMDALPIILHIIGRLAFPIFAFFIAEGYHYTRNKNKYMLRVFILALISHVPYMMASVPFQKYGWLSCISFATGEGIERFLNQGTVLFPYFIGLVMLRINDIEKLKTWHKTLIFLGLCVLAFPGDWSCIGSLVVVSIGSNRGKPLKQIIWAYIWIVCYAVVYFFAIDKIYAFIQLATILVVPLLYFYNGKKSEYTMVNKVMRYFFYIFYPLHLLILGIIAMFI